MKQDNIFKKIWHVLHSMKFGIILLAIIGVSSISGTIIPQNNPLVFYEKEYSSLMYKIISTLGLYKVYSSWWFMVMAAILSINLILCSIIRFSAIIKQIKEHSNIESESEGKKIPVKGEFNAKIDIEQFFKDKGFSKIKKTEKGEGTYYFSQKNSFGYIGSWLSHVGLLIIILAYIFGKVTGFETLVYGVPGTIHNIEGTSYALKIDDFNIEFRDDHTVKQYTSHITVSDKNKDFVKSDYLMVNHPFRMKGMNIYQNATGWAVDIQLEKEGAKIAERTLYQSEIHVDDDNQIALQFVNFYPDFILSEGMPRTLTPYLNNPKLLYAIFYKGYRTDMNVVSVGDTIAWEEYTFKIDNPREFTLLQIVSDPGIAGATIGGIVLLLGIILAFYIHPKQLSALETRDGKITIWGSAAKNQDIFEEEIELALEKLE